MQTPSSIFNTLRERPGNHITQKLVIEVGNYALASKGASVAASSEFSSDWPAAAVVNGDRTHINAGAASVAENNLGGSVWQSANLADGSGNISEWLIIDLGTPKLVNRIKLIFWPDATKNNNLGAIAPADFLIEFWDGVAPGYGGGGYGDGPFGDSSSYGAGGYGDGGYGTGSPTPVFSPWSGLVDKCAEIGKAPTSIAYGQVTGNANDMVVFEDPEFQTVQQLRISISKLQAASVRARIVAIEVTQSVDISSYVISSSHRLAKDYHLNRRQATTLQLSFRNFDGRFNERVVPTATQTAAGWFNPLIRPNMEIRYYAGFSGVNVQIFTGYIDYWEGTTSSKVVRVQCRDFYKFLLKPKITTKLKTNWTIEARVELVANYQNFPSNLIHLDETTVTNAYFAPKDESVSDVLGSLEDATGNSEIYLDETGNFYFRSYLTVIKHIWAQGGSQSDFLGGTNVNNTDANAQPGALVLAKTGGLYYPEGNWYSALSPILLGKVSFDQFIPVGSTGPSTSIDYFMRVTNDGGATFTPWRELVIVGGTAIVSKWNHYYGQAQIWARLRSSDQTQTPVLNNFTLKYTARGGSTMVNTSADWATRDNTTLLDLNRRLTDSVGGANYLVSKSVVKAKPTFLGSGAILAWQGTYNNAAIGPSNPLPIPVGVTTLLIDFGENRFDIPQTLNMTLGTAVATAALTQDPSKPVLTITATTGGTITGLSITGSPFVQTGTVEAISYASDQIADDYGINEDVLDNNNIDNVDLAQSIADNTITIFGKGPLDWIQSAPIRFTPNAQINDRVTVRDTFTNVDDDYVLIGIENSISANSSGSFDAQSVVELVRIGKDGFAPVIAAHYGSAGVWYYDGFRLGGNYPI